MTEYRTYNNNAKENNNNVNTSGRQYYNSDGVHKSTLELSFWNKMVSLKIYPMLPEDKITESERFDYNNGIFTAVSTERAIYIHELIMNHIIPALESGQKLPAKGYPIGQDSALVLGTNQDTNGNTFAYIGILKGIDSETMKPSQGIFYQFNRMLTIEAYDYEAGSFEAGNSVKNEIYEFALQLKHAAEDLIGASTHADRYIDRNYRNRIGEATGAFTPKGDRSNNTPYNNSSVFGNKYNGGENKDTTKPEYTKVENVEDINKFVDM